MITSVRFYLSYGPLKSEFSAVKIDYISKGKRIVDTDVVNDVTRSRKVLLYVRSYDFYDTTLSSDIT